MLSSFLVVGVTLGCFAGLLALGFSLVYSVLGEANLAYGDAIMLASFIAVACHERLDSVPLTVLVGLVSASALLMLIDRLALRPLRGRGDALSPIMATIGIALILRNVARSGFGSEDAAFPPLFGSAHAAVADSSVDVTLAWSAAVLLVTATTLALFLQRTDRGRAVRAVRQDALAARLNGIPVGRVMTLLYGLCGVAGGMAALLQFAHVGSVSIGQGFRFTLVAFAASALGGGRSVPWAVAGGLLLGFIDAAVQLSIGAVWTPAATVGVLVAILIVRPRGLGAVAAGERF